MRSLSYLLLFFPFFVIAQDSFSKDFTITIDNDLFASYVRDQYYTNGLFFEYRNLNKKSKDNAKVIDSWSLNQQLYSPFKSIVIDIKDHDRPFAGYLFVQFSKLRSDQNSLNTTHYTLGVLGPASLGKQFQTFIHDIYGFKEPIGWKYQIKNTLGLNFGREFIKKLKTKNERFSDLFYSYFYNVGTIHNNLGFSLQGRIGFKELADVNNSIAFKTNLNHTSSRKIESLLFWKLSSNFILYDATLQGSLFHNKSPITFEPNRFRFSFELSYLFTAKNWNFGYKFVYNSNEKSDLVFNNGHYYGSIMISKLFN